MTTSRRSASLSAYLAIALATLAACTGPTPGGSGCTAAPDATLDTIAQRLKVKGQLRYGAVRPAADGVVISAELHLEGDDPDENGDILTWAAPAADAKEFTAVDTNAREKSAWPPAAFRVTSNGGIESRGCTVTQRREAESAAAQ